MNNTAVALGFFDGVHLGHALIANQVMLSPFSPVIYTFDTHPKTVLGLENELIFTNGRKKEAFSKIGVNNIIFENTTEDFLKISKEDFVRNILFSKLNCRFAAVGEDYTFGYKGLGDAEFLKSEGKKYGIEVKIVSFEKYHGDKISSSYIKQLIKKGDFDLANSLMILPYEISGTVIAGRCDGRKLGFPTANVLPPDGLVLPPNGVYFTDTYIDGKKHPSITNLGNAPTFGENRTICETNILNFSGDLYGKHIQTEFLHFHRSEKKFDTFDTLKQQIANDALEREKYGTN